MNKTSASKRSKPPILPILLIVGGGLAIGYLIGKLFTDSEKGKSTDWALSPSGTVEWLLLVTLAVFSAWFVIAIHELGHLLTGLAQGFRFALYIAGPLGARNEGGQITFFWNKDTQSFGGIAATLPRHFEDKHLIRKYVWAVAAGPLSSLLWSVFALWLGWWLGQGGGHFAPLVKASVWFLWVSGIGSLAVFALTATPMRSEAGFMSDGARVLSLLRKGESAAFEQATLAMVGALAEGRRYGELPEAIISRLAVKEADSAPELGAWAAIMLYHMERNETREAAEYAQRLEGCLRESPPFIRHAYGRDLTFFFAFFEKNKEKAEEMWESIASYTTKFKDATYHRVWAALHLLSENEGAARASIREAEKLAPKMMLSGLGASERHWINRLEQALETIEEKNHE